MSQFELNFVTLLAALFFTDLYLHLKFLSLFFTDLYLRLKFLVSLRVSATWEVGKEDTNAGVVPAPSVTYWAQAKSRRRAAPRGAEEVCGGADRVLERG